MGNQPRLALVLAVALTSISGACSAVSTSDDDRSVRLFDCLNPIDISDGPPDGYTPILDVVALPSDRVLQRGRFDDKIGRTFSKFGLVLRADRAFTLNLAEASQPNALMGWGAAADPPVASLDFTGCSGVCRTDNQPNCPLGESGDWVVFPGGVWTVDPACIVLEVIVDGEIDAHRLPVGVECT